MLITGGSGLVGSAIDGDIKLSSAIDLRNWDDTINAFEYYKPDMVVHCAARVGGAYANMRYNGKFFLENVRINTNVLEACRITGVKKVISFLSTCIFPDKVEYPLTEDKMHLGEPPSSNYGYAYSKRMLAVQSKLYNEQYGTHYISVIPTNIYGKKDNFNLDDGHVVPVLIHRCYLAKKNNTNFEVWGDGTPLRELVYADDIGKLTEWALDEYDGLDPIIFSNSIEVSIRDLVNIIVDKMNFKGRVVWQTDKPEGQFRKPTDNSRLMSYLPDFKFTPIEEGIEKTVNWLIENYKDARK